MTIGKQHKCLECGESMSKTSGDHDYGYDHGKKILLRDLTIRRCPCGHYEVEIPRMGPLHEAIAQALSVLRIPRESLAFFFKPGSKGVEDGAWDVSILSGAP
jgi:hypothetical protein